MKTPEIYKKNLKNRKITREMLEDCLYSVNKRAKNARDKERQYRGYIRQSYSLQYKEKKEEYYEKKDKLLTLLKPDCIHFEEYVYDKEKPYYLKYLMKEENLNENEERIDDYTIRCKKYYLYYKMKNCSFHTPISYLELDKYKDLKIIHIGRLKTKGKDIHDLVSVQFVDKVIELIEEFGEEIYVG